MQSDSIPQQYATVLYTASWRGTERLVEDSSVRGCSSLRRTLASSSSDRDADRANVPVAWKIVGHANPSWFKHSVSDDLPDQQPS